MNYSRSQNLALYASFAVMGAFSMIYLLAIWLGGAKWNTMVFLGTNLLILPVSFAVYKYVLDKFIYEKVRVIYKTIHNLKVPKRQTRPGIFSQHDLLEQANMDVQEWVQAKTREIDDLRKLEEYRREFLGNISHELKTPIFNIQGYILTLLDGGMDDPQINRKYLERTEQSIDRMISIINDLEAISRYEAGEQKLQMEHFDIILLTHEVIEFLEMRASEKDISIFLARNYEAPVMVYADRERIRQVLTNLIVNSIKYGVVGGRTKISFFDMDENTLVEVTDSGMGIPREELPRVFERFYRGDKSRTRQGGEGGSGLGLAIVKHIIEAHSQTINVRSTPGVGSTFAFTLRKGKVAGGPPRPRPMFLF